MRHPLAPIVIISAFALSTACGRQSEGGGYVTRDSAGVAIVENTRGAWTETTGWRASDTPVLVIGVTEGPPELQLFRVRDARKLADGRIVVANSGTGELRFFHESGRYEQSAGRPGEGPGEYETLAWIRRFQHDSLLAYDLGRWGGSILDRDGAFGRSFRLAPPSGAPPVFGFEVLPDGTILGVAETSPPGLALGLHRVQITFFRYRSDGELLGTLGPFPGRDVYMQTLGGGDRGPRRISGTAPFGRRPGATVRGDRLCIALADGYEIDCYDTDGTLRQSIRRAVGPRPVTDADFERYVNARLARIDGESQRREWEPRIRALPVPETMPPYDTLAVDARDNLWVRELPPSPDGRQRWTVFDAGGVMLGSVYLPEGLRVTQIGDDFVLGIWQDELGVESVRQYALIKP